MGPAVEVPGSRAQAQQLWCTGLLFGMRDLPGPVAPALAGGFLTMSHQERPGLSFFDQQANVPQHESTLSSRSTYPLTVNRNSGHQDPEHTISDC